MSQPLSGLQAWLLQRISALYLVVFLGYMLISLLLDPVANWQDWRQWIHAPWRSVALLMFFLALLVHSWVGIRDVVLDYLHQVGVRLLVLSLVMAILLAQGLWLLRILLGEAGEY